MSTYNGPLKKAPAREGLIDIQFAPTSYDVISEFNAQRQSIFQKSLPIWEAMFGIALTPDGLAEAPTSKNAIGFRLESSNPPHVVQCRTQGFTFSRLSPYGSWEDLRAAAKVEWDVFRSIAKDISVHRIAVRYINELKIPIPFSDFEEYLTSPPTIPDGLPQALSSFLQRIVIPDDEHKCVTNVTQVLEEGSRVEPGVIKVLLDIDVFRMVQLQADETERIWAELDELRVQKNRMFFGHITDKMVDLLK